MRNQLLGTTALVAAGLFVLADAGPASAQQKVEPLKVTIGGYAAAFVSFVDQDDRAPAPVGNPSTRLGKFVKLDTHTDQEIHFNGRTTLANGITVGFRIELEGNTSGDTIDESWLFAEGKFGRIELGQLNNVHYRMGVRAPDVFTRGWLNEGNLTNVVANPTGSSNNNSTINATIPRFADNDSDKINVYTPRFMGLQVGASYIPDSSQDSAVPTPASTAYTRGWAVAGNFIRSFGPVDISAYAGYFTYQGPQTGVTATGATVNAPDPDIYAFGGQIGFAGFRVGGSYGAVDNGRTPFGATGAPGLPVAPPPGVPGVLGAGGGGAQVDGRAWDIGASYTAGPASVSLTYFNGRNNDGACVAATQVCAVNVGGDDKLTALALAGKYVIGPGISIDAVIFVAEFKGNDLPNSSSSSSSSAADRERNDNEAVGGVVGLVLVF